MSKTQAGATTTTYQYDRADRLEQTVTGGVTTVYGRDANGNVTGRGADPFGYDLATG